LGLGTEGGLAYAPRLSPVEYEQLIGGIREVVHRVVPLNATVLVASKGDNELVNLGSRPALHFPRDEDGRYSGYHPADSEAAIQELEQERADGAEYFLLPATGFWWLEFYDGFRKYIEQRYQVVESNQHCWIAKLSERVDVGDAPSFVAEAPTEADRVQPLQELIAALLPSEAQLAFVAFTPADAAGLGGHSTWLVPQPPRADSKHMMESIRSLERSGVQFVVIPASAFEWLDEHPQVAQRLRSRHRFVTRQEHLCEIYQLESHQPDPPVAAQSEHGSEEGTAGARSFGELLRNLFSSSRRNGYRP
jgi:hypothetical protein